MATLGNDQVPTISFNEYDDVSDFHNLNSSILAPAFYPFATLFAEAAQRLALAAAGEKTAWEQYKLEVRKMPVDRADSQPSAARIVRRFYDRKTR